MLGSVIEPGFVFYFWFCNLSSISVVENVYSTRGTLGDVFPGILGGVFPGILGDIFPCIQLGTV